MPLRRPRRRARGVALLLVMIVLLLVATLAVEIAQTAKTHFELADHAMNDFLLRSVVEGRREILKRALAYDQSKGDNLDTEDDEWSYKNKDLSSWGNALEDSDEGGELGNEEGKAVRYRSRDVKIEAWCEDERAKINLRALVKPKDDPSHRFTREALVRLIDLYREDWNSLDLSDSEATDMVDELVDWLHEGRDTEDNPEPATKPNRGRLLTVDDLLRVPGGKWTIERFYDVRDPDTIEDGEFERTYTERDLEAEEDVEAEETWTRKNGVPGLARYLSVWTETGNDPPFRININTAPDLVLRSLLDDDQEELAEAIIAHRREGATADDAPEDTSGSGSDEAASKWFKSKADLSKVDGMDDDLTKYPRLNYFADVQSSVFSLRIIATVVAGTQEGDEETEAKEIRATLQVREVVQRTQAGFLSLYAERRRDPVISEAND